MHTSHADRRKSTEGIDLLPAERARRAYAPGQRVPHGRRRHRQELPVGRISARQTVRRVPGGGQHRRGGGDRGRPHVPQFFRPWHHGRRPGGDGGARAAQPQTRGAHAPRVLRDHRRSFHAVGHHAHGRRDRGAAGARHPARTVGRTADHRRGRLRTVAAGDARHAGEGLGVHAPGLARQQVPPGADVHRHAYPRQPLLRHAELRAVGHRERPGARVSGQPHQPPPGEHRRHASVPAPRQGRGLQPAAAGEHPGRSLRVRNDLRRRAARAGRRQTLCADSRHAALKRRCFGDDAQERHVRRPTVRERQPGTRAENRRRHADHQAARRRDRGRDQAAVQLPQRRRPGDHGGHELPGHAGVGDHHPQGAGRFFGRHDRGPGAAVGAGPGVRGALARAQRRRPVHRTLERKLHPRRTAGDRLL